MDYTAFRALNGFLYRLIWRDSPIVVLVSWCFLGVRRRSLLKESISNLGE